MDLVDKLYENEDLEKKNVYSYSPFSYFSPSFSLLSHKNVRTAVINKDYEHFIEIIRRNLLPGIGNREVEEVFRNAMNRGINSMNRLCLENLGTNLDPFIIEEVPYPLNLFSFLREASEDWINARNGKKTSTYDSKLLLEAYKRTRAFGLGYIILMIDESPEVLNSLRHRNLIRQWIDDSFRFRSPENTGIDDLPLSWKTDAGVRVYGNEDPVRYRVKVLDEDDNLKYSSILMKMFLKGEFPESIKDYVGVEFIVEGEDSRDELLGFFRGEFKISSRLESFKPPLIYGIKKRSLMSSPKFDCTKFIMRPAIQIESVPPLQQGYERIPLEVQILTLKGQEQRKNDPEVEHRTYKERQFKQVFPLWFPREIYEPIIRNT